MEEEKKEREKQSGRRGVEGEGEEGGEGGGEEEESWLQGRHISGELCQATTSGLGWVFVSLFPPGEKWLFDPNTRFSEQRVPLAQSLFLPFRSQVPGLGEGAFLQTSVFPYK